MKVLPQAQPIRMDILQKRIERKSFCDRHRNPWKKKKQELQRLFFSLMYVGFFSLSLSLARFLLCLSFSTNVSFFFSRVRLFGAY